MAVHVWFEADLRNLLAMSAQALDVIPVPDSERAEQAAFVRGYRAAIQLFATSLGIQSPQWGYPVEGECRTFAPSQLERRE